MLPKLLNFIRPQALLWLMAMAVGTYGILSCAAPVKSSYVTITHPAEVNLRGKSNIIIAGFEEVRGGQRKAGASISQLVKERLGATGKFKILDRNYLSTILGEQDLSRRRLADKNTILRVGKVQSGSIFLIGEIVEDSYTEELTYRDATCREPYKEGDEVKYREYACKKYTREGTGRVTVNASVIDSETSQELASRNFPFEDTSSTTATDAYPASVDSRRLLRRLYSSAATYIVRTIAPWDERVAVNFRIHKKAPRLQNGVSQIQIGEWDQGISEFRKAGESAASAPDLKPKDKAAISLFSHWNLGLAFKYLRQYGDSRKHLKQAFLLAPEIKVAVIGKPLTKAVVQAEIRNLDAFERKQKELQRQQSSGR